MTDPASAPDAGRAPSGAPDPASVIPPPAAGAASAGAVPASASPTTTLPPRPPAPPAADATPGPSPAPVRPASRVVALLTIVLGAVIVLGTVLSSVFATVSVAWRHSESHAVAVAGVTDLDVDSEAGDLTIVFDDVEEATLDVVDGAAGAWSLRRDGDELTVESPRGRFFGWLFGGGAGRATLTLPESLSGVDASLGLAAGSLTAAGDFGELELTLAAGDLDVSGSARGVDATIDAGTAALELADVSEADFTLSAGNASARLTGTAPREIGIDVSAGSLDLTVPDESYAVTSDVSAGGLDDSRLQTSSSSARTIDVQLSAGRVTLRGA